MTILTWLDQNGMVASLAKFRMMFHGKKVNAELHLNVDRRIIPEDEQVKLLCVAIDNNLSFNSHFMVSNF